MKYYNTLIFPKEIIYLDKVLSDFFYVRKNGKIKEINLIIEGRWGMSNVFDMLEKAKELHKEIDGDEKAKRDCRSYIANNIAYFYREASTAQFIELINIYKDCFKDRESNIVDILKSKNIPYILAYLSYQEEITIEKIKELARESYKEDNLVDSLEYIKLLYHKYDVDLEMCILKGDILRNLGVHNGAVEAYREAKSHKSLDFTANFRIITTYLGKYKKELLIVSTLILVLVVGQFILFDKGLIPSRIYDFNAIVSEGPYITEGENRIIIPVDSTSKIDIEYKVMPFYGYEGQISYKIEDENIATLDENKSLRGISEGATSLSILRDEQVIHSYDIVVAEPKVERIELSIDEEISHVGDSGKIDVKVIRNYDFDIENEIEFKSTDKRVLAVDKDGLVEVVGAGKASIVVTCEDIKAEEEFIINLIVEEIKVDYDIDLDVGEEHKLKVEVITNSEDNKYKPKVMFSLEELEDGSDPIISMDSNGKIKGLREGTQIVKVSCGNLEKSVIVTINPKKIEDTKVENLKASYEIEEHYLNIDLTWDSIGISGPYEYQVYSKFEGEDTFNKLGTVSGNSNSYIIKYDLSNFDGDGNVEIYVIGSSSDGESKKSNIENIKFNYKNPINNNKAIDTAKPQ